MKQSSNILFVLACAGLLAAPATANPPSKAAATPAGQERVICKKSAPAGTRFRKETCYTAVEWDKLSETAKRDMGEMVFREPKKKRAK